MNIERPRCHKAHLADITEVRLFPEVHLHVLVALLLEGEPLSASLLRAKKGFQVVGILHVYPELLHASEFLLALAGLKIARELPLVHPHFHAVLRPKVQIEARLRRVGYVALLAIEPGIGGTE